MLGVLARLIPMERVDRFLVAGLRSSSLVVTAQGENPVRTNLLASAIASRALKGE